MRLSTMVMRPALFVLLLTVAGPAAGQESRPDPAAIAAAAAPVDDLLFARRYTLARGFRDELSPQRPLVTSVTIVVVAADPGLTRQRNSASPTLYAGSTPVLALNRGESGRLIGMIAGNLDLASAPLWFSLPARSAGGQRGAGPRALASPAGIRPLPGDTIRRVTRPTAAAESLSSVLRREVADLVLRFSPAEKDIAEAWRRPVAGPARRPAQRP